MRIELITRLIGDADRIKRCAASVKDVVEYVSAQGDISESGYASRQQISAQAPTYVFDDEAAEFSQTAVRAIIDDCRGDLEEIERDDLSFFIADDLHVIATSLEYGVDLPFVTALWLCYRAEELPMEPLEVDLPLKDALDIDRRQARKLLNTARQKRGGELAEKQTEQDTFGDRIAAAESGLPDAQLLKEVLLSQPHFAAPWLDETSTTLATTIEELPAGVKLPATWRKLLRAQEQDESLDWKEIWGGFEKLLPAAFTFLKKHCCGIAVATPADAEPQLLYIYSCKFERYACGYTYGAYMAGPPLGARVPRAKRPAFDILPPQLQEFYTTVHDGWCQIAALEYGPVPLGQLYPLIATLDANNMPPIPVDTLWGVMRVLGGGRTLCLDVATRERKRPKAVFFYPAGPPETGLDFWKEYKHWLAEGLSINEMLPKP